MEKKNNGDANLTRGLLNETEEQRILRLELERKIRERIENGYANGWDLFYAGLLGIKFGDNSASN